MKKPWIEDWDPEDEVFWEQKGRFVARRNLVFSIFAEFLGFSIWVLWSISAAHLNRAGFNFTTSQLYTLVAVPALIGATVRIPYTLAVARFGGRNWTVASALLLLLPISLHSLLVTNPSTPFWLFLIGGAVAGLGGGNFASSMSNISHFYPDRKKGLALGVNAAGGNLGVAVSQGLTPLVIGWGWLAVAGGGQNRGALFLQNAGLLWVPFILASALGAWLFMDNLRVAKASFREQAGVMKRRKTWAITLLYVATFGSFVGYSAGLPLLMKTEFPGVNLSLAFLGPLVGALARPLGGMLADRMGGARLTFRTLVGMLLATCGLIVCLSNKTSAGVFPTFLGISVLLFAFTGLGNGAAYQMIPTTLRALHLKKAQGEGPDAKALALKQAKIETSAAVGFIGAVGAYGGWMIPQTFGLSISMTGAPFRALELIMGLYLVCLVVLWTGFLRPERALASSRLAEAEG
jgi:NNP family nitrate/nitrite transporter-like MFS transporter